MKILKISILKKYWLSSHWTRNSEFSKILKILKVLNWFPILLIILESFQVFHSLSTRPFAPSSILVRSRPRAWEKASVKPQINITGPWWFGSVHRDDSVDGHSSRGYLGRGFGWKYFIKSAYRQKTLEQNIYDWPNWNRQ